MRANRQRPPSVAAPLGGNLREERARSVSTGDLRSRARVLYCWRGLAITMPCRSSHRPNGYDRSVVVKDATLYAQDLGRMSARGHSRTMTDDLKMGGGRPVLGMPRGALRGLRCRQRTSRPRDAIGPHTRPLHVRAAITSILNRYSRRQFRRRDDSEKGRHTGLLGFCTSRIAVRRSGLEAVGQR